MSFLIRARAPLCPAQLRARALDTWRDAELFVQLRWWTFLEADGASRPGAFAAYVAALDAEATAAGELAHAHSDLAEAA
ncbi:MAG: hypothetical protein JWR63_1944 [Conexibacter sp.]|nr:hypothetical protein [Conexibacter sp.]